MEETWDGLPVAREPPYACCVVGWREAAAEPCLPATVADGLRAVAAVLA